MRLMECFFGERRWFINSHGETLRNNEKKVEIENIVFIEVFIFWM
jgi:hypothetical protein